MTKKQLLSMEHTISKVGEYITLTADSGYCITLWKSGSDIATFSCFTQSFMPIRDKYPEYRVITTAEAERLQAECNKAIEANAPQ